LADAMTTAHLLLQMQGDVKQRFAKQLAGQAVDHRLLQQMQRSSKSGLSRSVQQFGNTAAARPC
jgi:DNA polymerase-3 subunit epsilon